MRISAAGNSLLAPTLPTSCGSLPPEGAGLAWGGPALRPVLPAPISLRYRRVPPEGAECRGSKPASAGLDGAQKGGLQGLRLRPGKAGSAAPAVETAHQ
jgi:hypothetical protein